MNAHVAAPFAVDDSMRVLVERIRGFAYDDASPTEMQDLCSALKLVAEDTVQRWETVVRLEQEAREKVSMGEVRSMMRDVLGVTKPGKPWWRIFRFDWPR